MNLKFTNLWHAIAAISYLALLLLQVFWHFLLPAPNGSQSWLLALIAAAPLLLPLKGVLKGQIRGMTWAGYLMMLYFSIGVMESWSNPPQRIPALVQTALSVLCVFAFFRYRPPEDSSEES